MMTRYTNSGTGLRYACDTMAINYAQAFCQSLAGQVLDDFISEQALAALQPAALEISLKALEDFSKASASNCTGTGSSGWNAPITRPNGRTGNSMRSNPRTVWWRAPWSGNGKPR